MNLSHVKLGIKKEDVINLHNTGLSPLEISKSLNCSISNISKRLIRYGIKPFRKKVDKRSSSRYKINELYFDEINTEKKAYFLGLLYADGSVFNNGFYLKIKDEDILQRLKEELDAEQPIKNVQYGEYSCYLFTVCSKKLSESLINHGCFQNKTYILKFPQIEEKLIKHFIRGFYDGDGSLYINSNINSCKLDITSASIDILKSIRTIFTSITGLSGSLTKECKNSNAWHLRVNGRKLSVVMDWFYKDATVFMKRKYDKFLIYKSVHLKSDKLLENPEEDNQQPITNLND